MYTLSKSYFICKFIMKTVSRVQQPAVFTLIDACPHAVANCSSGYTRQIYTPLKIKTAVDILDIYIPLQIKAGVTKLDRYIHHCKLRQQWLY